MRVSIKDIVIYRALQGSMSKYSNKFDTTLSAVSLGGRADNICSFDSTGPLLRSDILVVGGRDVDKSASDLSSMLLA